jgi:hypothetical protein
MKYRTILSGFTTANMLGMFTQSVASEGIPRIATEKSGASFFFSDVRRECLKNGAGMHLQMIDCITEKTERLISFGRTILKSATKHQAPSTKHQAPMT